MSDLRFDPVTGTWVAIARNRLDRPMEFIRSEQVHKQLICPFCSGNEELTPGQYDAFCENGNVLPLSADPTSWTVRAVPNKYPSFHDGAGQSASADKGPFGATHRLGHQEIVIPSPRHITSLSELDDTEIRATFRALQIRLGKVQKEDNICHIMLFMNCRLQAGASLGHIHFQLIGSPIVSQHLQLRVQRNLESVENFGQTTLQRIMEWESQQQVRIVSDSDNYLVICPYASRFAFQSWVVPKDPSLRFAELENEPRNELAQICHRLVSSLDRQLDQPAYNLLLHQAPHELAENDHWYIELFPRLTQTAGFEWGTNIWVNPIAPEAAAKRLQA